MDQNNSDMKWKRVELGEVCLDFQNGIGKSKEFYGMGVKVANIGDLYDSPAFKPVKTTLLDVSEKEKNKYALKKGDVLFVRSSVKREGVGYCSMYDSDELCLFSSFMIRATPNEELVLPKYLAYILRAPQARQMIINAANTATITNVSQSNLKSLKIPLPPLTEQRRLAARLDKADAVRQKSRAVVEAYAALGRSVFLEVFGDPVKNEKGWEVVELKDVAIINPRKEINDIKPSSKVDFIGMANVSDISKQLIDVEHRKLSEVSKGYTYIPNQSVILAKITPCFENGKVAIADLKTEIGFGSTEFHVVIPQEKITKEFIKYVFMSETFMQKGVTQMTGSAGQKRIPTSFLKKLQIPLPPLPLQTRFAAMVANIEAQRRLAERQLSAAEAVFGRVLQSTFEM